MKHLSRVNAKKKTGLLLSALVMTMLGMAYASVPLYRLFCQKTGYGGTPQIAQLGSKGVVQSRELTIQFVARVHRDLPWEFQPLQRQIKIKVGENALAFYRVKNLSSQPGVGMAVYNVSPDQAAVYFNKIECFCFEAQRLEGHQELIMPVSFYIDPSFVEDKEGQDIKVVTLSYIFFKYKK